MLKFYHYGAFFLGAVVTSSALADCNSPTYLKSSLSNELRNNTICYTNHQEEHRGRGRLFDYKTGVFNDPIDPKIQVGTWTIIDNGTNPAQVQYYYSKGTDVAGPFTFTPHNDAGDFISYCDGNALVLTAFIARGFGSGCP